MFLANAGLAAAAKHGDVLAMKIPSGWKVGNSSEDPKAHTQILELIHPDDDFKNWKELLTEASGPAPHGVRKPGEILNNLKAEREKECPGSTVWKVIETDEDSITYDQHTQACLNEPEQIQIGKILLGKKTLYFVQYAKKAKELPADDRATWLKWLGEVTLTFAH
jgi:hypothetical protein